MNYMAKWMEGTGPENTVVVSTRVRVARNLQGIPFPGTMKDGQAAEIVSLVDKTIGPSHKEVGGYRILKMAELSQIERLALVEKHLISLDLANKAEGAVAISEDQAVAVMINEEDHLRIQCLLPGLQLETAWQMASKLDDTLEAGMPFAFHEEYGYLTACPTNAGTGMRASVMLHLPALVGSGQIGKVLSAIGQFGLMARGIYGEGTQATGQMFQISNQVTSGLPEEEIIRNLRGVVEQIVAQEKAMLHKTIAANRIQVEDRVYRALGLLSHVRVLSTNEAMSLISDLRLGSLAGIVNLPAGLLSELMVLAQPGTLQKEYNSTLDAFQRDVKRAEFLSKRLNQALRSDKP